MEVITALENQARVILEEETDYQRRKFLGRALERLQDMKRRKLITLGDLNVVVEFLLKGTGKWTESRR